MYRLSSTIVVLLISIQLFAQSPHGEALKIDCAQCHNPESWSVSIETNKFDHTKMTQFKLEETHAEIDCKECHSTLVFNEAKPQCISCHTDVHSASVGNDCARCHTPKNWIVNNIDEIHEENGFALNGVHRNIECVNCHTSETNLRFDRIGNDCISCHQTTFNATTKPNHSIAQFSTDCTLCHSIGAWTPSNFNHDFFPLTLGHNINDCTKCHTIGNFTGASPVCVSCHQTTFNTTTNPNHASAQFSTDCTQCHTTGGWTPSTFDHSFFPLTLGHNINDCTKCHIAGNYSNTSPNCVSCHQANYDVTTNPNHLAAQFPTDCIQCHTTGGWTPSSFDHSLFPLTLGHDIQNCSKCHIAGNYSNTSPNCVSCHQANYDATTNPNHVNAQFTTDCISCHTPGGWVPSTFDHSIFPLTLGHNISDCTLCHISGNYSSTSPQCVSCHQANYNATTNPNHASAGFNTDCASCHTPGGWVPSTFDHNIFPLTLGHNISDCTRCHTTGNYTDASPVCVSCHQATFNATTNPNHASAQFPTDCTQCHTTGGWTPANWDHDSQYFPISSGKHQGFQCIECHTTANNYAAFSCITCHEHSNQGKLNGDHSNVSGYAYVSSACYQCHPQGRK